MVGSSEKPLPLHTIQRHFFPLTGGPRGAYKNTSSLLRKGRLKFDGQRATNLLAVFCFTTCRNVLCVVCVIFSKKSDSPPKSKKPVKKTRLTPLLTWRAEHPILFTSFSTASLLKRPSSKRTFRLLAGSLQTQSGLKTKACQAQNGVYFVKSIIAL